MTKKEFIARLEEELSFLDFIERREAVKYYDELIQDAIDNGQDESMFIERLGTVPEIGENIRKDRGFIEKAKGSAVKVAGSAANIFAKAIGYFVYFLLLIVVVSVTISLIGAGIGMMVGALGSMITNLDKETIFYVSRIGLFLFGAGFIVISAGFTQWFVKSAARILRSLLAKAQALR